jgi:hypothetical protein
MININCFACISGRYVWVCVCVHTQSRNIMNKCCFSLLSLGVTMSNISRIYRAEQHKKGGTWRRAPCETAKDVAFLSNSSAKSSSDTSWMHISCSEEWGCKYWAFSYEFISRICQQISVCRNCYNYKCVGLTLFLLTQTLHLSIPL